MNDRQQQLLSMLMGNETEALNESQRRFFFTLVGMAQWALEHPSTSRFEYISPERVKANEHLKGVFMNWWYKEHPVMKSHQEEMFEESIKNGLCPAGVVEYTLDGHHPIGWSWGSGWYLADYYLCLTRAIIQHAEKVGNDLKSKFAPIYIATEVFKLNRVDPTPEIIEAIDQRLKETEKTRSFGVVSGEVN